MSFVKFSLRLLIILGILSYFLIAAGLLVTRYWLLPRVDQWRPDIEQAISQAVGTEVRFEHVKADWYGLNANLTITNLRVLDDQGVAQLGVPRAEATLSWRSLLAREPLFRYIEVDDVILVARRAPDGQLFVGGFEIQADDQAADANPLASPAVTWLLRQGRVNVLNTRAVWIDQQRNAVPLVLDDIDLTLDNGLLSHSLRLRVSLPSNLGGVLELAANVDALQRPLTRMVSGTPSGYVYLSLSAVTLEALQPWVDVPDMDGRFAARAWLDLQSGKLTNFSMDLAASQAVGRLPVAHTDAWRVGRFQGSASGPVATLVTGEPIASWVQKDQTRRRLAVSMSLENGYVHSPVDGMQPLWIDQVSTDFSWNRLADGALRLDVSELAFANADGLMTARGSWQSDGAHGGGVLDFSGTLARFELPTLYKYLPADVGQDVLDWLAGAFKGGNVPRASFSVKGPWADFPFTQDSTAGVFEIDGTLQDWQLDYVPVLDAGELPWPMLENLNGSLRLRNDQIAVDISAGALAMPDGQRIELSALTAELANYTGDAALHLQTQTQAQASVYLDLFEQTALKDIAPAFVQGFKGQGQWSMPMTLSLPLSDFSQTAFRGELSLNGGELAYATSPTITDITGVAVLTEKGFESEGLAGTFLGGQLQIEGGVNETLSSIQARGNLDWAQVATHTASPAVGAILQGSLPYEVTASFEDEHYEVVVKSDLKGTTIALPAPLGLGSGQSANTNVNWRGYYDNGNADRLTATIANRLSFAAVRSRANNPAAFFSGATIAIGAAKPLSGQGLRVSAQLADVDAQQWMALIDALDFGDEGSQTPLMPNLTAAELRAQSLDLYGHTFDDIDVSLQVTDARQHVVHVQSQQTKGVVQWAMSQGQLVDGYQARFDRLVFGTAEKDDDTSAQDAEPAELPPPGTLSNLPPIDLQVADLTLFGKRLGQLRLEGRNGSERHAWQIRNLEITTPHGRFSASGQCRFNENPGISLEAKLDVDNLGDFMEFVLGEKPVRNGRGGLEANIQWDGFPWRTDFAGLSGQLQLRLEEGVFDQVSSGSARVLELLSLQSLSRLLSLDLNREETFEQGFPWNTISGDFEIDSGVVRTENLMVASPVASISLTGDSSLVKETWDMRAVVRPNLDLSGAAIATGFVVNPLVGLSALIGQYVLRNPVEAALSQRYVVRGTWDAPEVSSAGNDRETEAPTRPEIVN